MIEFIVFLLLICWLLFKLKILEFNHRNFIIIWALLHVVVIGVFLATRYYAFVDITRSATVKAKHILFYSPASNEVTKVFVKHNQKVKKGDPLYSYNTTQLEIQRNGLVAKLNRDRAILGQYKVDLSSMQKLKNSVYSYYDIKNKEYEVQKEQYKIASMQAQINQVDWTIHKAFARSPSDGYMNIIYLAAGQYVKTAGQSRLIMYTDKKFIELRIPDQVYSVIIPGAYAEFYVNTYPGRVFRAKVESVTQYTGEAMDGGLLPQIRSNTGVVNHVIDARHKGGRIVILTFKEPKGVQIPIGSVGSVWVTGKKPAALNFLDLIAGIAIRTYSMIAYLKVI